MRTHIKSDDAVKNLADAIVADAVKDYMYALRDKELTEPYTNERYFAEKRIDDCERFFRSDWFSMLCDLDGEFMIRICEDKVKRFIDKAKEMTPPRWMFDKRPHFQYTCPLCQGIVNHVFITTCSSLHRTKRYELSRKCTNCGFSTKEIIKPYLVEARANIRGENDKSRR